MKSRILIADDHGIVRQGLRELIARIDDMEVVGETADGPSTVEAALELKPDLLVLDITLPKLTGIEVMHRLRDLGCDAKILFLSMHSSNQYSGFVRQHGAQGFLSKDADADTLKKALIQLSDGGTWFPDDLLVKGKSANSPFDGLSRRESEVMLGLIGGVSINDIAENMALSPKSVSTYRRRLLNKMSVSSNSELAVLAARYKII